MKDNKKSTEKIEEDTETRIEVKAAIFLIFVIVIVSLFGLSAYLLNASTKMKRQIRESEIAELKAEIIKWKIIAEKVIKKEIERKGEEGLLPTIEGGVSTVKNSKMEEWYKTKENAVREIKRVYGGRIKLAAKKHGIDPRIITAIILIESSGDRMAVSRVGARGLMQLMPPTAKIMGIKDSFHPYENVWAGTRYLKQLIIRFGDSDTALAAYNMGPTAVAKLLKNNFNPSAYVYTQKVNFILAKI